MFERIALLLLIGFAVARVSVVLANQACGNLSMLVLNEALGAIFREGGRGCLQLAVGDSPVEERRSPITRFVNGYEDVTIHAYRARVLLQQGEYRQLIEEIEGVGATEDLRNDLAFILAEAHYQTGDERAAARIWNESNLVNRLFLDGAYGKVSLVLIYRERASGGLSYGRYLMLGDSLTKNMRIRVRYRQYPEPIIRERAPYDCDTAVRAYEEAERVDPAASAPHEGIAFCYYWIFGEFERAVAELSEAIELSQSVEERFALAVQLGEWHRQEGVVENALRWFDFAREARPESALPYIRRGMTFLYQLNSPSEAVGEFELAAEKEPENAFVYLRMGQAYEAMGDTERAEELFGRALTLNPDLEEASDLLRALGDE